MYRTGDLECGIMLCGQGVGLVHDVPTVAELFDRMTTQAEETVRRLSGDFVQWI
jgi:nitronate monooxygenase